MENLNKALSIIDKAFSSWFNNYRRLSWNNSAKDKWR